jgi:hypothetical protein
MFILLNMHLYLRVSILTDTTVYTCSLLTYPAYPYKSLSFPYRPPHILAKIPKLLYESGILRLEYRFHGGGGGGGGREKKYWLNL